jgi:hypothetical protein
MAHKGRGGVVKPAVQKPDSNTQPIRLLLKDLQQRGMLDFFEPPSGYGCDYVVFMRGLQMYVEVKTPEKRNRLTAQEIKLRALCKKWMAAEFVIVTEPEELLDHIYGGIG